MTPRYLVIALGDRERRRDIAARVVAATDLAVVADRIDLTILADTPPEDLGSNGPLLLGDIFFNAGMKEAIQGQRVADAITPQALISGAWGRYIAVWDDGERRVRILRDPSGAAPCYYRSSADLILAASDLDLLELAAPTRRALDWSEIGRILVEVDLRGPATAITGTLELLAGTMLNLAPAATLVSQLWSPWNHINTARGITPDDHAARLRASIETVLAAYAQAHPHAVATVSGGLDSSIVALTLAKSVEALTCITLATLDPSGDERRYARLVAEAARCAYDEHVLEAGLIDLEKSQAAHLPRPIGRPYLGCMASAFVAAAHAHRATAIFNGTGGDNVFCFLQSATPVADRLAAMGISAALSSVRDVAHLTGASYVEVATAALRQTARRSRPPRWRRDQRFLSKDLIDQPSAFEHPWLTAPAGARLGSAAHIALLLRIQNYLDPWTVDMKFDVINPLLAQPIVECCLGIPSWEWCRGGVNRAVARQAFADMLPPPIQRRTWKGGPDSFINKIVSRQRTLMRAMLLDGMLASQGLLDRPAVAAVLDNARPPSASDALRLLMLTDAEAWVQAHA